MVAMVANGSKTLYTGAFGRRDSSGVPVRIDSVFQIMSMKVRRLPPLQPYSWWRQQKVDLDKSRLPGSFRNFTRYRFWRDSTPMASRPCGPHPHRPLCATC